MAGDVWEMMIAVAGMNRRRKRPRRHVTSIGASSGGPAEQVGGPVPFGLCGTGLIDAVIEARMGPINVCRAATLAELDGRSVPPTPRDLVAAGPVEPLAAATLAPGSLWARFLAQGVADPRLSDQVRGHVEGASFRAVRDRTSLPRSITSPSRSAPAAWTKPLWVAAALPRGGGGVARRRTFASRLPDAVLVADLIDACVGLLHGPDRSLETRTALEGTTAVPTRRLLTIRKELTCSSPRWLTIARRDDALVEPGGRFENEAVGYPAGDAWAHRGELHVSSFRMVRRGAFGTAVIPSSACVSSELSASSTPTQTSMRSATSTASGSRDDGGGGAVSSPLRARHGDADGLVHAAGAEWLGDVVERSDDAVADGPEA